MVAERTQNDVTSVYDQNRQSGGLYRLYYSQGEIVVQSGWVRYDYDEMLAKGLQ